MRLTWVLAVSGLTKSSAAISSLLIPRATRPSTSRSRGVSSSIDSGTATAGSGREAVVDVLVALERREHDYARSRQLLVGGDAPGGLDTVHHRHANVHEHDVGPLVAHDVEGLDAGGGLPHHREVGFGVDQRAQPAAHQILVVHQHDGGRAGRVVVAHVPSPVGITARTSKPPSGRASVVSVPPSARARSCMPSRPWCPGGSTTGPESGAPSSRIVSSTWEGWQTRDARTRVTPAACLSTLVVASWVMR